MLASPLSIEVLIFGLLPFLRFGGVVIKVLVLLVPFARILEMDGSTEAGALCDAAFKGTNFSERPR